MSTMEVRASDYDMLDPKVRANPYPYYEAMRRDSPIHRIREGMPIFAVSRFRDVEYVLHHPEQFSSTAFQAIFSGGIGLSPNSGALAGHRLLDSPMMISVDPPNHMRLRGIVNRGFTPRRIAALEPRLREIAESFVGDVVERGAMELVQDLSIPFPVTVIAELLGIDPERREDFKRWSDATVIGLSGISKGFTEEDVRRNADEMADFIDEMAAERRENPKDDLISTLVSAQSGEEALSDGEVRSFVFLLLVAGNETTTNLIGNAVCALLRHPDQLKQVQADSSLIPQTIEEVVRYDSPIQTLPRVATETVELDGGVVEKGAFLMTLFASANRDDDKFPDAAIFDIHRKPQGHMGFGHGIHFCLGASLARLEAKIALETLLSRCRDLTLRVDNVPMLDTFALRGPQAVPIAFKAA